MLYGFIGTGSMGGVLAQCCAKVVEPEHILLSNRTREPFLLVSMAAGLTVEAIRKMAGDAYPVLRIMPNTACAVGEGMTLYTCSDGVTEEQKQAVLQALSASGLTEEISEGLLDAGSAVAGCGGAFACLFLEGLVQGPAHGGADAPGQR